MRMQGTGAAPILQYGKVRFVNEGDIIHASELVSSGDDHRDASFVRVSICIYITDPYDHTNI
jgi:hypothetical protein